ncbi:hypothetical protein PAMC26510_04180 [Caballeronia sordidicola]|uniref:Uncharacterized protein n=1 Tax=Caballeronia sordidicola TaxID=196367 RepID=A0A242N960_CABSO|nr:hypothetical protein PAMC26510_04180 [Caballeronia sordidicola]
MSPGALQGVFVVALPGLFWRVRHLLAMPRFLFSRISLLRHLTPTHFFPRAHLKWAPGVTVG